MQYKNVYYSDSFYVAEPLRRFSVEESSSIESLLEYLDRKIAHKKIREYLIVVTTFIEGVWSTQHFHKQLPLLEVIVLNKKQKCSKSRSPQKDPFQPIGQPVTPPPNWFNIPPPQ